MPESQEGPGKIDPRQFEGGFERRAIPHGVRKAYHAMQKETAPFRPEVEGKVLDSLERATLEPLIVEYLLPAADEVGAFRAIYPYDSRFTVDTAVREVRDLEREIKEANRGKRGREIIEQRAEKIRGWVEGTSGILKGAGATLVWYYDGLAGMANAVRTNPRYDVTATDLHKVFSSMREIPNWPLGKEIVEKQDTAFSILRGIAAAHHGRERNLDRKIDGDYPVSRPQAEFIERVFGKNEGYDDGGVFVIGMVVPRGTSAETVKSFYRYCKPNEVVKVVVGTEREITADLVAWLASRGTGTVLVNGVEWPVNEKTLQFLKMKVGSGDKAMLPARIVETQARQAPDILADLKEGQSLGLMRKKPRQIDNIFVMTQDPNRVEEVRKKLSVLLDTGIWEKLKDADANVGKLQQEFEKKLREHEVSYLNEHILKTARILLLYTCEGADLGWGFEYAEDEKLFDKKKGEPSVYNRMISSGTNWASTDISTPFHWLRSEANNSWKDWTHGALPIDKQTAYQINEHEPGWAPGGGKTEKEGWSWKINYLGNPLNVYVHPKFDLTLFHSMKLPKTETQRFDPDGSLGIKKVMDLITKTRLKMSEIPWTKTDENAPYRWFITLSQTAQAISLLSGIPNREIAEKFFGEQASSPRTLNLLELLKRLSLAHRDTDESEKDFLPFTSAISLAWRENLLPNSIEPGIFDTEIVARDARIAGVALEELAPKGDFSFGKYASGRFRAYVDQLLGIGKKVRLDVNRRLLRSRFG